MCQDCCKDRRRLTSLNHMTFGPTHKALDELTYFEEQLLSPIQPVVRIFTLYGTGLTGDEKSIVFYLKPSEKVTILSAGSGRSRRPGAAGTKKVSLFI